MQSRSPARLLRGGLWGFVAGLSACIVIPAPEHGLSAGRGEIVPGETIDLQLGTTTRKDILLGLGEPSASFDNDTVFVYHWAVVQAYWLFAIGNGYSGAADAGSLDSKYLFIAQFDGDGLLRRFERRRVGAMSSLGVAIQEWTATPFSSSRDSIDRASTGTTIVVGTRRRVLIEPIAGDSTPQEGYLVGSKTANTATAIDSIYVEEDPNQLVRSVLERSWREAGHEVVDHDPELKVMWEITHMRVSTPVNLWSWDAVCRLVVEIQIQNVSTGEQSEVRTYSTEKVSRTLFGPSDRHYESVIEDSVADIGVQFLRDIQTKKL